MPGDLLFSEHIQADHFAAFFLFAFIGIAGLFAFAGWGVAFVVFFVIVAADGLELQREIDRGIGESGDGGEGDMQAFLDVVEAEGDAKTFVVQFQAEELVFRTIVISS